MIHLPARFWKWRMRGAALYFINQIHSGEKTAPLGDYNGIIATDMMSMADFKALAGKKCPPAFVYFHENQITYPLAPGESRDFQFGFTNISTACAADQIIFNSKTHLDDFFSHLSPFLKKMPEYRPMWIIDAIRAKSGVIYPGCRFPAKMEPLPADVDAPPLIIWNHRWEFDKNPEEFFQALTRIHEKGYDFRLALLGENYQHVPKEFIKARDLFGDKIVRYGYVESKEEYIGWLKQGSVVVSTSRQENFGISVIEAVRHGCFPLLPTRLSYPEIIPAEFHDEALYTDQNDLEEKLSLFLEKPFRLNEARQKIARAMGVFSWENVIDLYDESLENLAQSG